MDLKSHKYQSYMKKMNKILKWVSIVLTCSISLALIAIAFLNASISIDETWAIRLLVGGSVLAIAMIAIKLLNIVLKWRIDRSVDEIIMKNNKNSQQMQFKLDLSILDNHPAAK